MRNISTRPVSMRIPFLFLHNPRRSFLIDLNFAIGVLYAEAKSSDGIPLSLKCEWFRVRGDKHSRIPLVASNIYTLSAEDLGCQI